MLRPVDIEILGTSGGSKIVPVLVNGVPGGDAFAVGSGAAQKCTFSLSKTAVRGRTRRSPESSSVICDITEQALPGLVTGESPRHVNA